MSNRVAPRWFAGKNGEIFLQERILPLRLSEFCAFFKISNRVAPRWFAGKTRHKLAQKRRSCLLITWNCGLKSRQFEDQVRDYDQNLVSLRIIWKITTNFSQLEDHLGDCDSNLVGLRITPEYFGQSC